MVFEFPTAAQAAEFVDAVVAYAETAKRSHRVVDVTLDVTGNASGARAIAETLDGKEVS